MGYNGRVKLEKKHSVLAAAVFVVGVMIFAVGFWSRVPAKPARAASGYTYYRAITVTSTASVASGTLTSFPMLVSSTLSTWEPVSDGGHIQNLATAPNGGQEPADLVFSTSTACTSPLNFETESYTSSTGALVDWVNVPTMQAGAVIYACYDNSSVTTDQSHPSSTWNSNYKLVYHMADNAATKTVLDSTANNFTGHANTTTANLATTSIFGGGFSFNGNDWITASTTGSLTAPYTIDGWFKPTDQNANSLGSRAPNDESFDMGNNGSNGFSADIGTGSSWLDTSVNCSGFHFYGSWFQVVFVVTSTYYNIYVNGVTPSVCGGNVSGTLAGTALLYDANHVMTFNADNQNGTNPPTELMAEQRLISTALTPQWILTEYNNKASPSTFYAVGSENGSSGGGGSATSTWIATANNSWSVPTNWSTGVVPGSTTSVLYSGSSTINSVIDTSTAIQGFTISSVYTGAITQSSSYTLSVASSGFSQAAGNFIGGTGAITVNGPFSLTGGAFTSTQGNLYLYGASTTFAGSAFNNNGGTVILGSTSTPANVSGTVMFYNLLLGDGSGTGNSTLVIATGTTLTVTGATTFAPASTEIYLSGGGSIVARGNILLSGTMSGTAPTSSFNLTLSGSSNQTINDQGHSNSSNPFYLPSLTINKSGGIALVSSTYLVVQSTTIAAGEFRIASNTVAQTFVATSTFAINSGAVVSDYAQASSTITFGSTVTNNGGVFFDGSGVGCLATPAPNYVILRSTVGGAQRTWSGTGKFIIRYANVQDQTSSVAIPVLNGTNNGNNGANWTFNTGAQPQLVQSATSTATSGSQSVTAAMPFWPRAGDLMVLAISVRNQSLGTPTDTAGNAYTLIASSTFGSDSLGLYYAKNVSSVQSPFSVTANGASPSGGNLISIAAFEYTGVAPSSTFNTDSSNYDLTGNATTLTSNVVTGQSVGQIFFGASSYVALTTLTSGSGWTAEAGITNNNTTQALYTEDITTTTALTSGATWTSAASTSYGDIVALFRAPFAANYVASGTVDSATFDTGVASGTQINSVIWQGSAPSTSGVGFQFAVSNSSSGPWSYSGPTGASSYFGYTLPGVSIGPNTPINLGSISNSYSSLNGYRYFRYRTTLFSDPSQTYAPTVTQVIVNWSP